MFLSRRFDHLCCWILHCFLVEKGEYDDDDVEEEYRNYNPGGLIGEEGWYFTVTNGIEIEVAFCRIYGIRHFLQCKRNFFFSIFWYPRICMIMNIFCKVLNFISKFRVTESLFIYLFILISNFTKKANMAVSQNFGQGTKRSQAFSTHFLLRTRFELL